jgi:2-hydroxyglutarate dehydrogenase
MLYEYCEERGIPHKRLGKLIVATGVAETAKLDTLLRNAKENGVNDLRMMEHSQAMEMEPELRCLKALLSPTTGIIDSHSFMLSLLVYDNHIKWLLILFVFFFLPTHYQSL